MKVELTIALIILGMAMWITISQQKTKIIDIENHAGWYTAVDSDGRVWEKHYKDKDWKLAKGQINGW
jgi:hypothetical protein